MQIKKSYELIIYTTGGSISDNFYFDTLKEAQEELDFYRSFYGKQYKYEIIERREGIQWKATK